MECGDCKSRSIYLDDILGEYYCNDCGLIMEDNVVDYSDLAFTLAEEGKPATHSPSSLLNANKGLGTFISVLKRLGGRYFTNSMERSFSDALPSLRMAWNSMHLPQSLRLSSAILYRKCIRKRITAGRGTLGMALATAYLVCTEAGVTRDLVKASEVLNVPVHMVYSYSKVIKVETVTRLYVRDYVRKGIEALSLPSTLSRRAATLSDAVLSRKLEIGRHPAAVAGAIIYVAAISEGQKINPTDIAKAMGVSDRSIRRIARDLDSL